MSSKILSYSCISSAAHICLDEPSDTCPPYLPLGQCGGTEGEAGPLSVLRELKLHFADSSMVLGGTGGVTFGRLTLNIFWWPVRHPTPGSGGHGTSPGLRKEQGITANISVPLVRWDRTLVQIHHWAPKQWLPLPFPKPTLDYLMSHRFPDICRIRLNCSQREENYTVITPHSGSPLPPLLLQPLQARNLWASQWKPLELLWSNSTEWAELVCGFARKKGTKAITSLMQDLHTQVYPYNWEISGGTWWDQLLD